MKLDGKKILVAGASGMAGRAVVRHLLGLERGVSVRASTFRQGDVFAGQPQLEAVQGDLRVLEDCRRIVRGCDAVVMVAATTGGIAQQKSEPWRQVNDNLIMNAQLLEALHAEGVKRAILVGSATCYQEAEGKLKEGDLDWSLDPHEAYLGIGWVTRYLEKLALFWNRKAGLGITCVRSANIYGPYAKFDPAVSNFIPALVRKAVDRLAPFEVWGSPDATRDVIYADDFASACAALLEYEGSAYDVFNVGSSQPTCVGDVVTWALQAAGYGDAQVQYSQTAPASLRQRVLDCAKLTDLTGWRPRFQVEEGVRLTVEWWKENKEIWKR